jgi:tau tubulin kinase
MLECVRSLHSIGYLHRDIKPANFMVDKQQDDARVYLIDYGLSQYHVQSSE